MSISAALASRSESKCELCNHPERLVEYLVPPKIDEIPENQIVLCSNCLAQIEDATLIEPNYWRCLNESMWNPEPAVQVMAYRQLQHLKKEDWANDLLGMLFLDEDTQDWAEAGESNIIHKDSNGNILQNGDTVTLIQDLNVKGANFTAKRGTAVRRIRLVQDNADHIEGKVDGQQIVILTKFVKKSN